MRINILVIFIFMCILSICWSVSIFPANVDNTRWLVMLDSRDNYEQDAFQHLKDIGVQAIVEDVVWSQFEPSSNSFVFTQADLHRQYCADVGLLWYPQIAVHYVPAWLYSVDQQYYFYDKNGNKAADTPPNFSHPNVNYYVDRAINVFMDHYNLLPFVYISSGQWGESYYPDGSNFYAFDNNTISGWRSYTGNSNAMPFSSTSESSGTGGTLQQFYDFWYGKMYNYISHTHSVVHNRDTSIAHGLKISANEDLGQDIEAQTQAALSYNLRAISHGGPISQTIPAQTLGETALSHNINAWVESFIRPYSGNTNAIKETRERLYNYGINGYLYATMYQYLLYTSTSPYPNRPREEFYRYKKLIKECGFGFETWETGFWIEDSSGGTCEVSSAYIKDGSHALHLRTAGGGRTASAYKDLLYDTGTLGNNEIVYPAGDVVLDGWRYLINSSNPSSLYWIVQGYDVADDLKVQVVYWAGSSNNEQDTAHNAGVYYLKTQLPDSSTTSEWIRTIKIVNQDIDTQFGNGTWDGLGIKKIRIVNKIWGTEACEGYFDEVKIGNTLPYGINTDFEYGDISFWHSSGSGYEISDAISKLGYSLHITGTDTVQIYQDYEYSSGPVVMNAWHYLVNNNASIYWKILGYGADESLKFTGIYWFGSIPPAEGGDIKVQLPNASQTGQWVNDIRIINDDFGQSAWNDLGITKLRLIIGGSSNVYIDNVQLKAEGLSTWYMSEGATYDGFDEFICIQNPSPSTANVTVTFMRNDGNPVQIMFTIDPTSRKTIQVNNYGFKDSVSTKVECTNGVGIIAERPMYLYSGTSEWASGHCSNGVIKPDITWYLAEGCTDGFDEFVCIQNPNNTPAQCRVTFMKPDGSTIVHELTVTEASRSTIYVNDIVPNESVSTKVESINGIGIIAERAMYWNAGSVDWKGSHCSVGVKETATTWYLAEGCTNGFDEWVLIQNPNSAPAQCRVTFMKPDGSTVVREITVAATSRSTIYVNSVVPNESVSTKVESINGIGVIAERAMYWDSGGVHWAGGHASAGITELATTWYLAEGCTSGFDEFVCIQNPNSAPAQCRVTFMKPNGSTVVREITVAATSRSTIYVNSIVPNESISTKVESLNGIEIVVERAMYWNANGLNWAEGHCSTGISQ